jgi:FkbM family methyltransferase
MRSFGFFFNRWFAQWWCRPRFFSLFSHAHKMTLRGLGMLNADGNDVTGEDWLLSKLAQSNIRTLIDVGANVVVYGFEQLPKSVRYVAFEPNPETFAQLEGNQYPKRVKLLNLALGATSKTIKLYDFADNSTLKPTQPTATLASTNRAVIEQLHGQPSKAYTVQQTTLDSFVITNKVAHVDLLKIDVEGYELAVLQGAQNLLAKHKVDLIQFEFNEMHVYHRVFFKDFVDILSDFTLYRLGPNGLLPLPPYRPLTHEVFAFQNILAISHQSASRWHDVLLS